MATILIDNQELEIPDGERLNGIQAAARLGIEVPHYCWHPGLSVVASCRMCLVETGRRDPQTGQIQMVPKLVPACQTPATDGTVFVTQSEKVQQARAMVEEDLLLRHPVDCPICDKAGECYLQDYHFRYGQSQRRADIHPFTSRRRPVGETVTLFVDRCIMCTRCVRFTREISGTDELMVINRGSHEEIDIFPGHPLANKLSGNVVDLCPVGALGDVDFLYRQRVWFMKRHPHVCGRCSTGCSLFVEENQDRIYRLKPRENMQVNQWWICDEGRYGYKFVHDARRLTSPRRRVGQSLETVEWSALVDELQKRLAEASRVVGVFSPFLTVEEAFLLATTLRTADPEARLVMGPVPRVGQDERFPSGFTIRAEKCPNRRGVEEILVGLTGRLESIDVLRDAADDSLPDVAWVAGGYPDAWDQGDWFATLTGAGTLVVQDLFPGPLVEAAHYQLPSAAYPERSGSFVNHDQVLQSFPWAIRPPAGVMPDGQFYWRLAGRKGIYQPRQVLNEVAQTIGYFAAAAHPVPETGIDLKARLLAEATSGAAAEGGSVG